MSVSAARGGDKYESQDELHQRPARLALQRIDAVRFIGAYALLTALWFLLGKAILASDAVLRFDTDVSRWFVRHRTLRLNTLTEVGSALSATTIKVAVTLVIIVVMYAVWRRWHEPAMVVLPLVLEAMTFITVTWMVGRPRPDVARLETSPVDSSFPSGHAAAAVVYSAIVVVVFWHTRRVWVRLMFSVLAAYVALIVGLSRLYRGMHHLTDVLAGFALGAVSIAVSWWILKTAMERSGNQIEPTLMPDLARSR